jgi:hypothetical protein
MTLEDKINIVISQLRTDRDKLQDILNKIKVEIAKSKISTYDKDYDEGWEDAIKNCLNIIDRCMAEREV